ncbi:MAG: hypothetical protein ACOYEP_04970 [Limnochordia bacterium]
MIEIAFDPSGYVAYVVSNATRVDALADPMMRKIRSVPIAAAVSLQQVYGALPALLQEEL